MAGQIKRFVLQFSALQTVTSHGGTLEMDSKPDRGTRFTLVLPLVQEPA